jgi:Rrf2 family protein
MKRNSRLSVALHVLLHLAQHPERPMTSEEMAECAGAHPVVIRQTFAGLRDAGIVATRKGRGGGWRLARPPAEVTLEQVQRALGERVVAVEAVADVPGCVVEQAVHHALDDALAEATRVLDQRLAAITLADLAAGASRRAGRPFSLAGAGRDGE